VVYHTHSDRARKVSFFLLPLTTPLRYNLVNGYEYREERKINFLFFFVSFVLFVARNLLSSLSFLCVL